MDISTLNQAVANTQVWREGGGTGSRRGDREIERGREGDRGREGEGGQVWGKLSS